MDPGVAITRAPRESTGGAIGVLLGLLLLAVAAWSALRPSAREVDGEALLAQGFTLGALPFGLGVRGAAILPGGESVVSLGAPGAALGEEPGAELARVEPPPSAGPSAGTKVDWASATSLAEGGPPERVLLVRLPRGRAEAVRRRHFDEVRFRSLEDLDRKGGRAPLERAVLPWHGLAARAVRERHYRLEGGSPVFRDSVRVDLARPGRAWMLVAIWPPRHGSSLAPVRELLEALPPAVR